jgi:hypothetical protein
MADSRLYVHVLLDRSGSMESCRDTTIDAFNSYVGSLAAQSRPGTRLSLTIFDSESTDRVFEAVRISDVPKLTSETFVPRGSTPLFDAVARVVAATDAVHLLPNERVALTILTDGQENSSREMTAEAVRKMLGDRQERQNWLVQYLGANQDAWAAGAQIGVASAHSLDYSTRSMGGAMSSAASSADRFRRATSTKAREEAAFTPTERAAAQGKQS